MNETSGHRGTFTIDGRDHPGDSSLITQPETRCSRVSCSCGWETPTGNLEQAKALLAQHQHRTLEMTL